MTDTSKDTALIQVLAERLEKQRLPRILALEEQVDRGEKLSDVDIQFLDEVFEDAEHVWPLVDRHPEWQDLVAKIIQLYKKITAKALENEETKNSDL